MRVERGGRAASSAEAEGRGWRLGSSGIDARSRAGAASALCESIGIGVLIGVAFGKPKGEPRDKFLSCLWENRRTRCSSYCPDSGTGIGIKCRPGTGFTAEYAMFVYVVES